MKLEKILNNELELLDIIEWGEPTGSSGLQSEPEEEYLSSSDFKKAVKEKLKERIMESPVEPVSDKKLTVGQEFINWAEQYWGLKRKYEAPNEEGSESCTYNYVKDIFTHKIDEIIKNRL